VNSSNSSLIRTAQEIWRQDLRMLLDEGGKAMGYRDPFFRRVALPMWLARREYPSAALDTLWRTIGAWLSCIGSKERWMLSKSSAAHNRRLFLLKQVPFFGAVLAKDLEHMDKVEHRVGDLAALVSGGTVRRLRRAGKMPRYSKTWRGAFRVWRERYMDPRTNEVGP